MRIIDDTAQRFLISGIYGQPEVGQHVLHFLTVVKRHSTIDPVRNIQPPEGFFDSPRLGIGTVQHSKCIIVQLVVHLGFKNRIGNQGAFFAVSGRFDQFYRLAIFILRPHSFLNLILIVGDDAVGGIHDHLGGTVILFQFIKLVFRVIVLKIQDILNVGSAKRIDTLSVITYHANILKP